MKTKIIHFIALLLLLLVTGVFWGTWFTMTRSIDQFSAAEFIHIGRVIIANVAVPMSILMPACIIFLGLSLWFYPEKPSAGFHLSIAALVLMIITLLVTLIILVPIDNDLKQWTASALPEHWEDIRSRWHAYHAVRTFTALASFACFALAAINVKNPTTKK
ncbi:DUF1772 domain-containing protein [Compostibacter hankyongensis]|uniref:DUF1772 domain-containing protein n=1 Tax=Compostibacter hankyongensis TaxID=1007089 RepID=A0ABP8FE24_9BACT